jgi:uncharacterized membrane protein YraQ (UPF0718 family)
LVGNVLAALLGIVTPFCSCSAVPLFIGFVTAGVPLGVTFSFLIAAPMVNEIALGLLYGLVGWEIASLYAATGLSIAVAAGWAIGRLKMEAHIEDWVTQMNAVTGAAPDHRMNWPDRIRYGWEAVVDIIGRVWKYILIGIALGALIHGYVPEAFMARIMGSGTWWSVPLAVVLGVPMYSNAAGIIPVVEALLGKGAALGSTLAFMMSVIALSLPEMVILRKVLKPRLIATFIAVVATGILVVGYLFNALWGLPPGGDRDHAATDAVGAEWFELAILDLISRSPPKKRTPMSPIKRLSFRDRYLTLWVFLAIAVALA